MTTPSSTAPFRVRAEQIGLFETPILHGHLADAEAMTASLAAVIRGHQAADTGLSRSNIGGWHSSTDMLQWGGPAAIQLADTALRMAKRCSHFEGRDASNLEWKVKMWANVSPPGALNMSHAHPGVLWAAVYYVDMGAGDDDAAGALFFEDPRFPVPLMRMPGFRVLGIDGQPQPVEHTLMTQAGDLVLFPAWVRHGVRPHTGKRDRISIAMNIDVIA